MGNVEHVALPEVKNYVNEAFRRCKSVSDMSHDFTEFRSEQVSFIHEFLNRRQKHIGIYIDSIECLVDARIALLVDLINKNGYKTFASCEAYKYKLISIVFLKGEEKDFSEVLTKQGISFEFKDNPKSVFYVIPENEHLRLLQYFLNKELEKGMA